MPGLSPHSKPRASRNRTMNAPRKKTHATTRVAAMIIIVVVLVIATLLYNAIKGKRAYEEQNTSAFDMAAQTAVVGSEAASPRAAASR
jgi:hypothetical protein